MTKYMVALCREIGNRVGDTFTFECMEFEVELRCLR